MIKNSFIISVFILFGISGKIFSQSNGSGYVIVLFQDSYKISQHKATNYFWIISQDSIEYDHVRLNRLFLRNYSKNNFVDCCNGKDIDPLIITDSTNYYFDSTYLTELNKLELIITKNKRLIQKVTKKWIGGQTEEISIFAIPISGKFCFSNYKPILQENFDYSGKIYIPLSTFDFSPGFWELKKSKYVLTADFSKTRFDVIPY